MCHDLTGSQTLKYIFTGSFSHLYEIKDKYNQNLLYVNVF